MSRINFDKCASGFSLTRSSKNSPTLSRSKFAALVLLTFAAASSLAQTTGDTLHPVPSRDRKVVHRWELPGDPRGVAIGADGTIYVGLAATQSVIAVHPRTGAVRKRLVLDSAHIAATKELVTLRTNPQRTRLYIANGSDESASILSLPDLAVLREITMEGETIRDVVPDPKGRYVYLLGRRVHVFDGNGQRRLRTLPVDDPMAIAASANGNVLAVIASEDFEGTKATVAALFDANDNFEPVRRDPLQTEQAIGLATFAAGDRALVAFSSNRMFDRAATPRAARTGSVVNSRYACIPEESGPQIATLAGPGVVVYAERRCSASGAFTGATTGVQPASLYGVDAYALAYDPDSHTLAATDRGGFLTIYHVPRPAVAE